MRSGSFIAYDTICTVAAFDTNSDAAFSEIFSCVKASAIRVQNILNMYDPRSELAGICAKYIPGNAYRISETLMKFLLENQYLYELTEGAYDPTIGAVSRKWDFTDGSYPVPPQNEIRALLHNVGFHQLELNPEKCEIRLHSPDMVIDPGASGKGFALYEALKELEPFSLESAYLNYGGNLFVIGLKNDTNGKKRKWTVGIQDSIHREKVLTKLELSNEGIATSSWYEHGFECNGRLYHHILDPRTGFPVPLILSSASIVCDNAFYTDLLSTAYFILGKEKGDSIIHQVSQEKQVHVKSIAEWPDEHFEMSEFHPAVAQQVHRTTNGSK